MAECRMRIYDMPEETAEAWNAKAARLERREMLRALWDAETDDLETLEWREDLTAEEATMVEFWDRQFSRGVRRMCEEIQERERLRHGG